MVKFYAIDAAVTALSVSKHEKPSDFHTSSWQRGESPVPMLVVRILLSSFTLAIVIWSIVETPSPRLLIYLTNWGVLLVLATTIAGLIVSCSTFWRQASESQDLPWFVRVYWVFFNVTVTISVMITALYWILLYSPAERDIIGPRLFMLDVTKHGITSCIVMAEFLLARTPVKVAHIYQPLGVALMYSMFNIIYYFAGGTDSKGNRYIYHVLDWQKALRSGIVLLGAIAALIVIYLLLCGLALCRDKLSTYLVRKKNSDENMNQVKQQVV